MNQIIHLIVYGLSSLCIYIVVYCESDHSLAVYSLSSLSCVVYQILISHDNMAYLQFRCCVLVRDIVCTLIWRHSLTAHVHSCVSDPHSSDNMAYLCSTVRCCVLVKDMCAL